MMKGMIRGVAVLIVCLAGLCSAEYRVYTKGAGDRSVWSALLGGGQHRMEAHLFRDKDMGLCVVDEGGGKPVYGSLEKAMQQHHCVAGVNGGYFGADAARTPIGLVRHAGHTVTPLARRGFTVAGVVYDTGTELRMERSARVQAPLSVMREAIQGGPFLVESGRVVSGLENTRKAARTFIATDGKGRWCLAVSSALTLRELAQWLAEPGCMGDFRVQSALNLDGGSSSAFWDKAAGVNVSGFKAVRNYVGIRPRSGGAPKGGSRSTKDAVAKPGR